MVRWLGPSQGQLTVRDNHSKMAKTFIVPDYSEEKIIPRWLRPSQCQLKVRDNRSKMAETFTVPACSRK